MKTIDITTRMSRNDIGKNELQNHIMKEKEYLLQQDIIQELREAIYDGLESGIAEDFNPELNLKSLKQKYNNV